jgi:hypothetical protein
MKIVMSRMPFRKLALTQGFEALKLAYKRFDRRATIAALKANDTDGGNECDDDSLIAWALG